MLVLAIRSHVAVAGITGGMVTGRPTARPSGSRGLQGDSNRPLLSLVVRPMGSSPLSRASGKVSQQGVLAAETVVTVELADKLRRVQFRAKGAVARFRSAKEDKSAGAGRGEQRSNARSGGSKPRSSCWNYRKKGHRTADCTTKRKSGPPRGQ